MLQSSYIKKGKREKFFFLTQLNPIKYNLVVNPVIIAGVTPNSNLIKYSLPFFRLS